MARSSWLVVGGAVLASLGLLAAPAEEAGTSRPEVVFLAAPAQVNRGRILAVHGDGTGLRVVARGAYPYGVLVSPDRRSIAYRSAAGLMVVAAEGGRARLITHGDDHPFSWSPDGRWILFGRGQYGQVTYLVAPNGTHLRRLPRRVVGQLAWTPDSKHLLATTNDLLVEFDLSGHDRRVPGTDRVGDVAFSPDGRSVVVTRDTGGYGAGARPGIQVARADFTHFRWLVRPSGWGNEKPVWSPDATRIAYIHTSQGRTISTHFAVRIIRLDGTHPVRIASRDDVIDRSPAWSPDGRQLTFTREAEANTARPTQSLWVADAASGSARKLYEPASAGSWITRGQ